MSACAYDDECDPALRRSGLMNCQCDTDSNARKTQGLVRFFSFAAGEFEDEELFFTADALAKAEGRTHAEVEAEFKEKLVYVKNVNNRNHPFETWGPQELADRINACDKDEDDEPMETVDCEP